MRCLKLRSHLKTWRRYGRERNVQRLAYSPPGSGKQLCMRQDIEELPVPLFGDEELVVRGHAGTFFLKNVNELRILTTFFLSR